MRRIALSRAEPGMIAARSICYDSGDPLVRAGTELTAPLITGLVRRGYVSVLVADDISDDVVVGEVISSRLRNVTMDRLRDTFASLEETVSQYRGVSVDTFWSSPDGLKLDLALDRTAVFSDLWNSAEEIVDEVAHLENLEGLAALRAHDEYTFGHSIDMAIASLMIGRLLHLEHSDLHQLALGSLLHDVGKIFIDKELIQRRGPLTEAEMAKMREHSQWGYLLLKSEGWGDLMARHIVYQHHEHQDGSGYPRGLHGNNRVVRNRREDFDGRRIILLAEVAAVADVYDALSSDRPYRAMLPHDVAIAELRSMAGHHLNREIIEHFASVTPLYPAGSEVEIMGGPAAGCRALVIEVPAGSLHRPVVRVFADSTGVDVTPFEIDLREEPEVTLASCPFEQAVAA